MSAGRRMPPVVPPVVPPAMRAGRRWRPAGVRCGRPRVGDRAGLPVIVAAAIGGLVLTGCSGPTGGTGTDTAASATPRRSQQASSPAESRAPIQTRYRYSTQTPLKLEVLALGKLSADELKLSLRVTNVGTTSRVISTDFADIDAHTTGSFSAVILLDGKHMKAYFPSQSSQGTIMGSGYPKSNQLQAGRSINVSIFYPAPPADVRKVDIAAPAMVPFNDIPVDGTARVESGEPDPRKAALRPPRIEPLSSVSDDLSGDKSLDESGDGVAVRLNTDVLFAVNKANLSGRAKGILTDVAKRIDRSKAAAIRVDGHTDSSGNDAINKPLSRRRAAAVAGELKKLVTRSGVTYQTAGHGASDPVATNDTPQGRKKNRRVTVTIGR